MATPTHNELLAYATGRCPQHVGGIGAAFAKDVTENDRDEARRWRFLIVNEKGTWAYVDFVATRVGCKEDLLVNPVEEAVETFISCRYARENRLASLLAEAKGLVDPIRLPLAARHRVPAPVES
jgi:hypothetical protein